MTGTGPEEKEKISAFVICMNEEEQIAECLETLRFCDEIVVIDSFSTDRTVEIAKQFGARVIQRPWPGYREQKSFGLTVCTYSWVINIDADERVSPELRESVLEVLRRDYRVKRGGQGAPVADGYFVNRVVFYLERWWRQGGWYPEYRLRFFRRELTTWGGVEPHEKPIVQGRTEILPGELQHFTYRNLDEQLARLHSLSTIAAREEYRSGERATLFSILVNPALRSIKFFILKKGYREGMAGLIVALAEGYYTFMKYAKIWEHEFWEKQHKAEPQTRNRADLIGPRTVSPAPNSDDSKPVPGLQPPPDLQQDSSAGRDPSAAANPSVGAEANHSAAPVRARGQL